MQRFLPYLPPHLGHAADPLAAEALIAIQEDLEWLLTTDGPEFWGVLRSDSSLAVLVDSFLRHARRPFDEKYCDCTAAELNIWRLLLAILHRGACASLAGVPAPAQRGAALSRLLDVTRILDLCALYWASEPRLLSETLQGVFRLLPALTGELAGVAGTVASNISQVIDACLAASSQAGSDPAMMQSVLDGVDYLRDACLTLCALLGAYPPTAPALLSRGGGLLEALAALHDSLLPAIARLASGGSSSSGGSGGGSTAGVKERLYRLATHIELASERAALLLLIHAYLEPADGPAGGSAAAAGGSHGAAGAAQRGEALLSCAMLLGHSEGEDRGRGSSQGLGGLPLGRALAERHGFVGAVESAMLRHAVVLDEAQSAYLAALLGVPSLGEAPGQAAAYAVDSAGAQHAGQGAGAGAGGVGGMGLVSAVLMSQIAQIQDLLPDYGDGYLAACLDAYEGRPEAVIDALLGGSLYPRLSDLDPRMTLAQFRTQFGSGSASSAPSGAAAANDKGKRPVGEAVGASGPAAAASGSRAAAAGMGAGPGPSWGSSSGGSSGSMVPAAAKPQPESSTAKYLDIREGSYRASLMSTATALQWEDVYDDEHDDSLDDLIHYGADGVTEAEEEAAALPPAAALSAAAVAGPSRPQQAGGDRWRGGRKQQGKLWVLDGRIYNYPKPGAKEVGSREDAEKQLETARQATLEIHGLGPGGNKPLPPMQGQHWRQQAQQEAVAGAAGEEGHGVAAPRGGFAGGRDGGRGAGGAGCSPSAAGAAEGGRGPSGAQRGGGAGGGRGRGRGRRGDGPQGGDGRGQRDHHFKDQHKAAIGNHHRKDRALKKAMGGFTG